MQVKVVVFLLVIMCIATAFASPIPIIVIPLSTLQGTTATGVTTTTTTTGTVTTTGTTTGTGTTIGGQIKPLITINFGRRRR
ncbi:hypothetical protein FHG87_003029 [Trinorchestia longiramus]|nr:hypothetical protein FHG87_003029 [Trinorchestia longiramus]